ncbi:hypothetical protein pb186bvf_010436 [Paramecium bursaria]
MNNVLGKNIEEENKLKEDELFDRVQTLKQVSLDIQSFLKNEKPQLNKINNDFDKGLDMVTKSIGQIGSLLKSGLGNNTCYVVGAVLLLLFILYML